MSLADFVKSSAIFGGSGGAPVTLSGGAGVNDVIAAVPSPGWTFTTGQWKMDGIPVSGQTALTYTRQVADIGKVPSFQPAGLPFDATAPRTLAALPGAPTIGTLTAMNAAVSGAFTAPGSNGGAAIVNYVMSVYRASDNVLLGQANTATSPGTLSGFANGIAVYCKFAAENSAGVGPQSAASNVVTPAAVVTPEPLRIRETFPANGNNTYLFARIIYSELNRAELIIRNPLTNTAQLALGFRDADNLNNPNPDFSAPILLDPGQEMRSDNDQFQYWVRQNSATAVPGQTVETERTITL